MKINTHGFDRSIKEENMELSWGNNRLKLETYTGVVISSDKRSETQVFSSGGGGYIDKGTGRISAPIISSRVTTRHEFWIKTDDGHEIPVLLTDADFPLATGQRITIVNAPKFIGADRRWIQLFNHNSNQNWTFNANTDATARDIQGSPGFWSVAMFLILLVLALIFGLTALSLPSNTPGVTFDGWLAVVIFAYLGYRLFRRMRDFKTIRAALRKYAEQCARGLEHGYTEQPMTIPLISASIIALDSQTTKKGG